MYPSFEAARTDRAPERRRRDHPPRQGRPVRRRERERGAALLTVLLLVIWPSVHWAAFAVALVLIRFNQLRFRQAVAVTT